VIAHRTTLLQLVNCVLWGNEGEDIVGTPTTTFRFYNNILEDGEPEASDQPFGPVFSGNISEDPQFVAPSLNDYRLRPGSPAIDAGVAAATLLEENRRTNVEFTAPEDDLDGNERPIGEAHDMGAYEFDPEPSDDPFDIDQSGAINAVVVQLVINGALDGTNGTDIDGDGVTNAVDVQFIVNAALGIR